jgi:hypothetical protein
MAPPDDGDIIRGLGYVTLYAAYLEEEIELLFNRISGKDQFFKKTKKNYQTREKLKYIKQITSKWSNPPFEIRQFIDYADEALTLLDRRNLVIHGRIYADRQTGATLKPARSGCKPIPANSADLYALAQELAKARVRCMQATQQAIDRYHAKASTE